MPFLFFGALRRFPHFSSSSVTIVPMAVPSCFTAPMIVLTANAYFKVLPTFLQNLCQVHEVA